MKKILCGLAVSAILSALCFGAQNYVSSGDQITFVNRTGATVTNGTLVSLGACYGIPLSDIDAADTGVVMTRGIFRMKINGTEAITNGLPLFAASATTVTKTASTNTYVGMATTTATGSTSSTVYVEFLLNAPQKRYIHTEL